MTFISDARQRHSIRLQKFDYSQNGAYFITICSYNKQCLFGRVINDEMRLSEFGQIASKCWHDITSHFSFVIPDLFVIMPNHIHGILNITDTNCRGIACYAPSERKSNRFGGVTPSSVSSIVRSYKSAVTKSLNRLHLSTGTPIWQRNYYEHVIRDEEELIRVREYIQHNPLKWDEDEYNLLDSAQPFANSPHSP